MADPDDRRSSPARFTLWQRICTYLDDRAARQEAAWADTLEHKRKYTDPDEHKRRRVSPEKDKSPQKTR